MSLERRLARLEARHTDRRVRLCVWQQDATGADRYTGPGGRTLTRAALAAQAGPPGVTRLIVHVVPDRAPGAGSHEP